jgi:hypothetical protein
MSASPVILKPPIATSPVAAAKALIEVEVVVYVFVSILKVSWPVRLMKPAVAVVMKLARFEMAGPILRSYVVAPLELALNPEVVPHVMLVLVAPAVPIDTSRVPVFTAGIAEANANVPVVEGRVITVPVPAAAGATSLAEPLADPVKLAALVPSTVIPPLKVTAVVVVAPLPVTVPRVSASEVRYVPVSSVQVFVPVLFSIPVPVSAAIAVRSASSGAASFALRKS